MKLISYVIKKESEYITSVVKILSSDQQKPHLVWFC